MDLVAACRVFVLVGERGSVTLGAAAARVPQPVASRRIAALERHLGGQLFDRSARRVALTDFGRGMLPPAKRLVRLADALADHAERARLRPLTLAVPATCPVRQQALLAAAAREHDLVLDFRTADPARRHDLLHLNEVRAALLSTPPPDATWTIPLGVAAAGPAGAAGANNLVGAAGRAGTGIWRSGPAGSDLVRGSEVRGLRLEELRPGRGGTGSPRLWIQPEDDVPHVRDPLERAGHRAALAPSQVAVAASLTAAVADVLRDGDLLLCPASQAAELGLSWRPLAAPAVARGYELAGEAPALRAELRTEVGRCLGGPA